MIEQELYNRKLSKQKERMYADALALQERITALEERNMELICSSIQVDWNLMYDEVDSIEDLDTSLKESQLPMTNLKPIEIGDIDATTKLILAKEQQRAEKKNESTFGIYGKPVHLIPSLKESAGQKYYTTPIAST